MLICGIDPGKKGGLVVLNEEQKIVFKDAFDQVESDVEFYSKISAVSKKYENTTFFKEDWASFGVDGRTSFVVGRQHGILDIAFWHLGLVSHTVKPAEWSKVLLKDFEPDLKPKIRNTLMAHKLFPGESFIAPGCRKEHGGLIDAALIAYYGWQKTFRDKPLASIGLGINYATINK